MAAVTEVAPQLADPQIASQLAGLDALEQATRSPSRWRDPRGEPRGRRSRPSGSRVFAWQLVVWSGWRPTYVLPGPMTVLSRFWLTSARRTPGRRWPPRCDA